MSDDEGLKDFEERLNAWKSRFGERGLDGWNKRLYRDDDGNSVKNTFGAEELWNEFGIKSGPKFREACWYHMPDKWADDVRQMIKQAQTELGDRISFRQIKEKFCYLTVYFDAKDEEAKTKMDKLIAECQDRLRAKDLHP